MNYHDRKFQPLTTTENGQVEPDTIFHYKQEGNVIYCDYEGKNIVKGQILGVVNPDGTIRMNYQQIDRTGALLTGKCKSTPETTTEGLLLLHEDWQWTCGVRSSGKSILQEVK